MNSHCSQAQLESVLLGHRPAGDEAWLHDHLEECETCREAIERLAGGQAWCRETAAMLASDELDSALPKDAGSRDEWSDIDFTVEHLEPSTEPGVLGQLGGYEVLEIIGRGGMGVVLKANDRQLKRYVAIKVLAPHLALSSLARKRFAREAQAAAAVVHPHVLAIHQVQPNGRLPFLVTPLVAGESLAQRLAAKGTLELPEILRIGMQAAAGLAAAHEQGLVHRDVKPANILLERGVERAVLTDFGLARAADDVALTRWGIIAGTPQYMSPEQAQGHAVDARSDLFSLGCVLYEMATGVSPFRADTTVATLRRLIDEQPRALAALNPELPPWFVAIVERLLEKDPARRFESAQQVSELLEGCLAHLQQPASVPLPTGVPRPVASPPTHAPAQQTGRRPARRGVLIGLALAALMGLAAFLFATGEPSDISGVWSGDEWGTVTLTKVNEHQYNGAYTDTFGAAPGEIHLAWSRIERQYNGTWAEGAQRFGDVSVHVSGKQIIGAWTTNAASKVRPGVPKQRGLAWTRPLEGTANEATASSHPATPPATAPGTPPAPGLATLAGRVLTDPSAPNQRPGGLPNAIIYATVNRAYGAAQPLKRADQKQLPPVELKVHDDRCEPEVLAVKVNQEIGFTNVGTMGNNVTIDPQHGVGLNIVLAPQQSFLYYPTQQESAPVAITNSLHPSRSGYLLPRNDGYFAVTDAAGQFEIRDLPADVEIEFTLWQNPLGRKAGVLTSDIPGLLVADDKFFLTLSPDQIRWIGLTVSTTSLEQPSRLTTPQADPHRPTVTPNRLVNPNPATMSQETVFIVDSKIAKNGVVFYDFETGKSLVSPHEVTFRDQVPEAVQLTDEVRKWILEQDVDLMIFFGKSQWHVLRLGMQETFLGQPDSWNTLLPSAISEVFQRKDAVGQVREEYSGVSSGAYDTGLSSVHAVRTRTGTMGVYQIWFDSNEGAPTATIREQIVIQPVGPPAADGAGQPLPAVAVNPLPQPPASGTFDAAALGMAIIDARSQREQAANVLQRIEVLYADDRAGASIFELNAGKIQLKASDEKLAFLTRTAQAAYDAALVELQAQRIEQGRVASLAGTQQVTAEKIANAAAAVQAAQAKVTTLAAIPGVKSTGPSAPAAAPDKARPDGAQPGDGRRLPSPRDTIDAFLAAVLAGKPDDAARLIHAPGVDGIERDIIDLNLALAGQPVVNVPLVKFSQAGGVAIGVSEKLPFAKPVGGSRTGYGILVFKMAVLGNRWIIGDMDIMEEVQAANKLQRFEKDFPDAADAGPAAKTAAPQPAASPAAAPVAKPTSRPDSAAPAGSPAAQPAAAEIHRAANAGDTEAVAKLLDDRPLLLDSRDIWGYTPLLHAVMMHRVDTTQLLLDRGANVELWSEMTGRSAPDYVVLAHLSKFSDETHWQVQEQLLRSQKMPEDEIRAQLARQKAVYSPQAKDDWETIAGLLAENQAKRREKADVSLLFQAIHAGDEQLLARALAGGADLISRDRQGRTPLIAAIHQDNPAIVEELLAKGASIHGADDDHKSALEHAKQRRDQRPLPPSAERILELLKVKEMPRY